MDEYRLLINRDLSLRERTCGSKAAYVSRGEARTLARHGRRADGQVAPYRCPFCDLWHLGHSRRRHKPTPIH